MDEPLKHLMQDLGNAINDSLSESDRIAEAIGEIKKAGYDVFLVLEATVGFNRTRTKAAPVGKDGGERILRCIGGPSCIAKNRYCLPAELPLDWDTLAAGLFNQPNTNQPQVQGDTENGGPTRV